MRGPAAALLLALAGILGLGVGTYFYVSSMPDKSSNGPGADSGRLVRVQMAGTW